MKITEKYHKKLDTRVTFNIKKHKNTTGFQNLRIFKDMIISMQVYRVQDSDWPPFTTIGEANPSSMACINTIYCKFALWSSFQH